MPSSRRRAAEACRTRVFIDSTGRTYALPAHSLPSARGQGEPLSGRLNPPDGAKFAGVMLGEPEDLWLLSTDAGYGFTVRFKELVTDRRAGKTVLTVPENAHVLPPALVTSADGLVCVVSSSGKMLAFPSREVPEMPRGKGIKLYDIAGKKAAAREEVLTAHRGGAPAGRAHHPLGRQAQEPLDWGELQGISRRARPARRRADARLAPGRSTGERLRALPAAHVTRSACITTSSGACTK